ncbi:hypothetical protein IFM89_012571 [Coptis chinensis]|uniref:F-box domain-containing protein n=1 Tax=Coptis chinensis TaxID=261450 RepID=A0A835H5H3_9MAGN|nr:hypothetical protein IFM89_012571 [Coptis chinensis]
MSQNWSELPEELLKMIAEKIEFLDDFVRFSVVCRSWSLVKFNKHHFSFIVKSQFPWLMLANDDDNSNSRRFFNYPQNKICHMNLSKASGCHCWGSPFGWLVVLGLDSQFHLLNPLSGVWFSLPSLSKYRDRSCLGLSSLNVLSHDWRYPKRNRMSCVRKAIIVSTMNNSIDDTDDENSVGGFLVFLIVGRFWQLAFARPGDNTWTNIISTPGQEDILHFNGRFYAVDFGGNIWVCDDITTMGGSCRPTLLPFASPPEFSMRWTITFYLVELYLKPAKQNREEEGAKYKHPTLKKSLSRIIKLR